MPLSWKDGTYLGFCPSLCFTDIGGHRSTALATDPKRRQLADGRACELLAWTR